MMMGNFTDMIFVSIVIPLFNSQTTIVPLLSSIASSKKVNLREIEVICVDDRSSDGGVRKIKRFFVSRSAKRFGRLKIIVLRSRSGPAVARNIGVKYAKGKVIQFFDADVVLFPNTLLNVIKSFRQDADLFALTGVWDKRQKSKKFFPKFKALRDWSYWINERDPKHYYYLFSTRVASIRRALFLRLGGFNESYKAALVEDIELTYRIAKRYAVVFNPNVIVRHEFEDFFTVAKKYFWRSFYWSRIYRERKKFDPVATTSKEAITTISAGGLLVLFVLTCISYFMHVGKITEIFLFLAGFMFIVHVWGVRKFLWFCIREEGAWFALRAFFTGIILSLVILSGSAWSFVRRRN